MLISSPFRGRQGPGGFPFFGGLRGLGPAASPKLTLAFTCICSPTSSERRVRSTPRALEMRARSSPPRCHSTFPCPLVRVPETLVRFATESDSLIEPPALPTRPPAVVREGPARMRRGDRREDLSS